MQTCVRHTDGLDAADRRRSLSDRPGSFRSVCGRAVALCQAPCSVLGRERGDRWCLGGDGTGVDWLVRPKTVGLPGAYGDGSRGAGGGANGWAPGGQERAAASGSEAANTGRRQLWHKRVLTTTLPSINTGFLGERISLTLTQRGRGHGSRLCAVVEGTPKAQTSLLEEGVGVVGQVESRIRLCHEPWEHRGEWPTQPSPRGQGRVPSKLQSEWPLMGRRHPNI